MRLKATEKPKDYVPPRGVDSFVPYSPSLKNDDPRLRFMLIKISVVCMAINFAIGFIVNHFLPHIPVWWPYMLYLVCGSAGTATHWLGHKSITGRWFRAHTIEHHVKLYPPARYLNTKQLVAADPNAKFYVPVMLMPFLISYLYGHPSSGLIFSGLYILVWLYIVDRVHAAFHLAGCMLEPFLWFQYLRQLHYIHHTKDLMNNMAILDFIIDFVTGALMATLT